MIKYHAKRKNVLVAMAKKGFNQKTLSEKAGLNPSTLSNFLNGRYELSPTSAKKIASALNKDIEDLFDIQIIHEGVKMN